MGFGCGIVSEFSFIQRTVQVINPLVLSKLGNSLSMCSPGRFQARRPAGGCNISSGEALGGLVLSCEEWEADSRRLSRLLLQASASECKIIHLEGRCLCKEGRPAQWWGDKFCSEMFEAKGQFVREAKLAIRALWCLLASATHIHLQLLGNRWALESSALQSRWPVSALIYPSWQNPETCWLAAEGV